MKTLLCFCVALAMTLTAATAMAADVTGTWSATIQTPNGDMELSYILKQDGAKITGTVQGSMGDPLEVTNGKIDGDNLAFDVSFNGMAFHYAGTVDGDSIKASVKSDSGDFPAMDLTLKRAKDAAPAPTAPAQPATPPATPAQPAAPAAPGAPDTPAKPSQPQR